MTVIKISEKSHCDQYNVRESDSSSENGIENTTKMDKLHAVQAQNIVDMKPTNSFKKNVDDTDTEESVNELVFEVNK